MYEVEIDRGNCKGCGACTKPSQILFLDDGKIVAEGNHEELLKTCNEYKKLYESEIEK